MIDYLIRFFTYNKLYLISGVLILLLIIIPTKEKISAGTKKALYVVAAIWIICFAYKVSTGRDIIYLFKGSNDYYYSEKQPSAPINE
jgi:hypothetical protein